MTDTETLRPYTTRISSRAKYLQIKLSSRRGVEVVIPKNLPPWVNVDHFVRSKHDWIVQQSALLPPMPAPSRPTQLQLQFIEETWQVQYQQTTGRPGVTSETPLQLLVQSQNQDFVTEQRLLKNWLRQQAQRHLLAELERCSQAAGLPYKIGKIRAQKTRWGSCSADKTIHLNLQLLFLPRPVVQYVIWHELAHTIHLNHGRAFWKLVERLDPNFQHHRLWLKHAEQQIPNWLHV